MISSFPYWVRGLPIETESSEVQRRDFAYLHHIHLDSLEFTGQYLRRAKLGYWKFSVHVHNQAAIAGGFPSPGSYAFRHTYNVGVAEKICLEFEKSAGNSLIFGKPGNGVACAFLGLLRTGKELLPSPMHALSLQSVFLGPTGLKFFLHAPFLPRDYQCASRAVGVASADRFAALRVRPAANCVPAVAGEGYLLRPDVINISGSESEDHRTTVIPEAACR
jgi:hypothetical protein